MTGSFTPADQEDVIINGSQTFDEYLGEARERFVRKIQEQEWNTPLRTEAENILIAYDQARQMIKNLEIAIQQFKEETNE
jgi:hypothetical protein